MFALLMKFPLLSLLIAAIVSPGTGPLNAADADEGLRVSLESFQVVDEPSELDGSIHIENPGHFRKALRQYSGKPVFYIRVKSLLHNGTTWETSIPVGDPIADGYRFSLPLAELPGGHNRLSVSIGEAGAAPAWSEDEKYLPLGEGGPVVEFSILEKRSNPGGSPPDRDKKRYLEFVINTVEKLKQYQSCPLGGEPDGVRLITIAGRDTPPRRELKRNEKGEPLHSVPIRTRGAGLSPEYFEPYGADLDSWLLLDLLAEVCGEAGYAEFVAKMAEAFVPHGFDPESGLGYFGQEAQLDVYRLRPVNWRRTVRPLYKHGPELPMERLWRHAPKKMHRMSRAMYYGLVTDPESMAYNRFCDYGFDDRTREHLLEPSEKHGAFESAAGGLIRWWGSCFSRTGDIECLDWAQKMADKWMAAQHSQSGLVPYTLQWKRPPSNPNTRGGAKFALALLKASGDFRERAGGKALAAQLAEMGLKLSRGVAEHGFDEESGKFRESLLIDGRSASLNTSRFFATQEEKDKLIEHDPKASLVPVYANGESFYLQGPYWRNTTGIQTPHDLAMAAQLTRDAQLIEKVEIFAERIMRESRALTSEFTPQGKWTFSGTGLYIKIMVALHETTGNSRYLQWARTLADEEIERLDRIAYPEWWRMRERGVFLEALLRLYAAVEEDG